MTKQAVDKGVPFGDVLIHTLGYADDAALVDLGSTDGIRMASDRVTKISRGARRSNLGGHGNLNTENESPARTAPRANYGDDSERGTCDV